MPATEHKLDLATRHFLWDRRLPAALVVHSGDTVRFKTQEVSGGQVYVGAPSRVVAEMDRTRVYPLTGPVFVEDARPGDVLAIEMLDVTPGAWGWTANIPGRGLLADDFPEPYIHYFELGGRRSVEFGGASIPIAPFCGTIGLAPAEDGPIPVRPPHAGGGNIDTRQLTASSTLYLPVQVDGALLSIGDGHAAQGDGEVCVTGIECDMTVTVRLSLLKDRPMPPRQYQLLTAEPDRSSARSFGSSASGPDLKENARNAVRGLIDWLMRERQLGREDAYLLCSLVADLRISQIVNDPNYCVTAMLPMSVFEAEASHG